MAKISFHGACREVTGSCTLVETGKIQFLVDCGIFQGEQFALKHNGEKFLFSPKKIDFVFLTHAHMDHCGRLPKLFKEGFKGKIYCTAPTRDLAEIMLLDSAKIIAREAEENGHDPLYTADDVIGLLRLFVPLPYDQMSRITNDIDIKMRDAGHILGSASIEIYLKEDGKNKKIVFSGDLGNWPSLIVRQTEFIEGADAIIIESTYAGVTHETKEEGRAKLQKAILHAIGLNGVLIIPIFVIEKTQELLFELNYLHEHHQVPRVPMFLDSPLAIKAIDIYDKYSDMFSAESKEMIKSGDDIFNFEGLHYTKTASESKQINRVPAPKVILASSGMCVGGRVPYHLRFNLPDPNSHVLLVAYQAPGTLGRKILRGDKMVEIDGYEVKVRAEVSIINSYSSHADEPRLLEWIKSIKKPKPSIVFVNHGEAENSLLLAQKIKKTMKVNSVVPEYAQVYEI